MREILVDQSLLWPVNPRGCSGFAGWPANVAVLRAA
jgi:hypothetical protein